LREQVNKESSSTSIEKVDMDVDAENFGPISSPTKRLKPREARDRICNISHYQDPSYCEE